MLSINYTCRKREKKRKTSAAPQVNKTSRTEQENETARPQQDIPKQGKGKEVGHNSKKQESTKSIAKPDPSDIPQGYLEGGKVHDQQFDDWLFNSNENYNVREYLKSLSREFTFGCLEATDKLDHKFLLR